MLPSLPKVAVHPPSFCFNWGAVVLVIGRGNNWKHYDDSGQSIRKWTFSVRQRWGSSHLFPLIAGRTFCFSIGMLTGSFLLPFAFHAFKAYPQAFFSFHLYLVVVVLLQRRLSSLLHLFVYSFINLYHYSLTVSYFIQWVFVLFHGFRWPDCACSVGTPSFWLLGPLDMFP